jgi:hypothetical protein
MAFNVPAALFCTLGLQALMSWVEARLAQQRPAAGRVIRTGLPLVVFAAMALASLALFRYALVSAPRWFDDYGLYGMQYGARQLFEEAIPDILERDPDTTIMVSSTWANGTDAFLRFFLPQKDHARVQMLNVDHFMGARRALDENILLIMTPAEYEAARASPKFARVDVERVIPYPDGRPGFYFARLTYADDLDRLLAQEQDDRSRPVVSHAVIGGREVEITHSLLDSGQVSDLFDGDPFTLARGMEANPLVFEVVFSEPRPLTDLTLTTGTMDFALTASLIGPEEDAEPVIYTREYRGLPADPTVSLALDRGPEQVKKLRLEILNLSAGPVAKIHVREIGLQP